MFTSRDGKDGELSNQAPAGVNITSHDKLFDQSECPILIFTFGSYTNNKYLHWDENEWLIAERCPIFLFLGGGRRRGGGRLKRFNCICETGHDGRR